MYTDQCTNFSAILKALKEKQYNAYPDEYYPDEYSAGGELTASDVVCTHESL